MRSRLFIIFLVIMVLLAATCWILHGTHQIEGVYTFHSPEVSETLELKVGGEFTQKIKVGDKEYETTGHWTLKANDLKLRDYFLVRFDTFQGKTLNPPQRYSLYSGYWDRRHDRISFDVDYDAKFFVKKESKERIGLAH